jgi:group I intron endonuclease
MSGIKSKMLQHKFKLKDKLVWDEYWVDIFGNLSTYAFRGALLGYVYMIRNIETGGIYIGQTDDIERRKSQHTSNLKQSCHQNSDIQMDYILYGLDSFIFEIVEFVEEGNLLEREKNWIKYFQSEFPNGYNAPIGTREEYFERPSKKFAEEFARKKRERNSMVEDEKKTKKTVFETLVKRLRNR